MTKNAQVPQVCSECKRRALKLEEEDSYFVDVQKAAAAAGLPVNPPKVEWNAVEAAADRLPPAFRRDALVRENLENFRRDLRLWIGEGK